MMTNLLTAPQSVCLSICPCCSLYLTQLSMDWDQRERERERADVFGASSFVFVCLFSLAGRSVMPDAVLQLLLGIEALLIRRHDSWEITSSDYVWPKCHSRALSSRTYKHNPRTVQEHSLMQVCDAGGRCNFSWNTRAVRKMSRLKVNSNSTFYIQAIYRNLHKYTKIYLNIHRST